ncbi:class I SAM-dependent methyltransferase [Ideonella sp. 4Y11]|uniref:Class I SAM-dependent methyltransferase n=1 Tax=Ideonella aquatica TaxID=2824119 RepID=A0A940YMG9_9BURK|nr:class I SAM-dependent methyltransferase [Ideonella aquatica]MBQ0959647.1 class I SAM-dependent methyltransferase [Ideonella aquatica]
MHDTSPPPSDWVRRWCGDLPPGQALDLACGQGRHLRWLARQGWRVTGVDRDAQALAGLQGLGEMLHADIENGPWPLDGRRFDLVVVTNYLWRPLLQHIIDAVAPGGRLVYETFAIGNERHGRPARPDFLLQPGELLQACRDLQVLGYESGQLRSPERVVQRIAAQRDDAVHPLPLWAVAPGG